MRIDTGTFEWAVFLRRLPMEPFRGGMTEQQVQAWLEEWQASEGGTESFWVAKRVVGPWEFMDGDEPFGSPRRLNQRDWADGV